MHVFTWCIKELTHTFAGRVDYGAYYHCDMVSYGCCVGVLWYTDYDTAADEKVWVSPRGLLI
jgi:hypothetical protein